MQETIKELETVCKEAEQLLNKDPSSDFYFGRWMGIKYALDIIKHNQWKENIVEVKDV